MNRGDWVMTNSYVGQIAQIGGMFCQIDSEGLDGFINRLIVPTEEVRVIPKEVADIMRSV